MKFTLTIDMGNAAFDDDPEGEVCRVLREVADKLGMAGITDGGCYDENGNRVGEYRVTGHRID